MEGYEKIYVSISAYLDLDAKNTILDCINKSKYPNRLVFGICWQFEENIGIKADFLDDLKGEYDIRIVKFHYLESEGPSWAKDKAKQFYKKEKFCLQIDAHMRFAQDWDSMLIADYFELKNESINPIISFLPPTFVNEVFEHQNQPDFINFPKVISVTEDNLFEYQENNEQHSQFKNVRSPILEPSFIFTEGKWLEDVLFNKDIYFIAEDVYQSVRAYTSGYDFFLPKQNVAWHRAYYPSRIKHYNTHPDFNPKEKLKLSLNSLNELLQEKRNDLSKPELRNLKDYETYADVKFNFRSSDLK
ncbi:GlcNAc-transferase family protein [Arcticibacterium luteifluviistationis]|uniref:GlcNAc-transferase family protein n=1 Tax=Arcticibacterium luteifluviistationis TaxID=1784714 RepID=UPI0019550973|nr:GlcNAc-transferase family protein [Arcticibacterium luteifluviistationis]